jgi:hypothetical protein
MTQKFASVILTGITTAGFAFTTDIQIMVLLINVYPIFISDSFVVFV